MKHKKKEQNRPVSQPTIKINQNTSLPWAGWLVFLLGSVVYLNTLFHDFTQDDAIVIYDNMFTTQGVKGIPGLFKYDTFFGFFKEEGKANLVSGGRYRPLTPAMFAVEYSLVGKKPWLGHFLNIILYGFLCYFIFITLRNILTSSLGEEKAAYMSLIAAALYAVHPLHTEVVANIKGRDEIMSMLGAMGALYGIIKAFDTGQKKYHYLAAVSLFLGLLSKENTITFAAIIPLTLYFFRNQNISQSFSRSLWMWPAIILFLIIRTSILGLDMGGTPMELMNNPFVKWNGNDYVAFTGAEKMGTIVYTLGKYLVLLVFPHPLTHDYYPRHIGIMTLTDPMVIGSILAYALLAYLAFKGFAKRKIYSFAILYFLLTTSIVSNIVFPIGTNMSERFMFMPSLGFTLLIAYLMVEFLLPKFSVKAVWSIVVLISLAFAGKTFARNMVWKNDYTLFTTDVKTSSKSAKVLNAAGGALTVEAPNEKNPAKQQEMYSQAVKYLDEAIKIHPTYKNAYLIRGNALFYLQRFEEAIQSYEMCTKLSPDFQDAYKNMAVAFREAGKQAGEKQNNLVKAEGFLQRSLQLNPQDPETIRLLGVAYGVQGKHDLALEQFLKVAQLTPESAQAYVNLYYAYRNVNQPDMAGQYLQKAVKIDPDIMKKQGR